MASHLTLGKFKINILEANARNSLLSYIEELKGSKAIIWDQELVGPMTLLRIMRRLKELGVEEMFSLGNEGIPSIKGQQIIFVVRPGVNKMDLIADYVHEISRTDKTRRSPREFLILFIPKATQMCERRLQVKGVRGSVEMNSVNFQLFPVDSDLMSMELEHTYREFAVEKDPSTLLDVADALRELEAEYGPFVHILGRGPAAKLVIDNYLQLRRTDKRRIVNNSPTLHHVIIFDRQLDLITPLATQLTYEGLIDEFFGINNSSASFPPDRFSREDENESMPSTAKKVVHLNSSDDLYVDLRGKNFNGIGPTLKRTAQTVAQQLERRHDKTMENMKKFVSQLPQLQATKKSLALHTTIAELIKERTDDGDFLNLLQAQQELLCGIDTDRILRSVEDAICKKLPVLMVLRLICLQSLVSGGLKSKILEHYKGEIIRTYGLQFLIPLSNLEKAGLIRTMSGPRHHAALRKTLRLIIEDDSETDPNDICFTHSIYAPLSIRLIQNFNNWTNMKDILDMVSGPTVEHVLGRAPNSKPDDRQLVLVFFVGGCTFSEISALRFLSQKDDSSFEFIVATTKIINGNSFLRSVMMAEDFPDFDSLTC